jgi:hypothetical protein
MPQTTRLAILIGLSGGLASAVLFYSAAHGSPALSAALLLLTPLPTLIAAVGWGLGAALTASLSCALVMSATVSLASAVGTLVSLGVPAIGIAYFAFLSRRVGDDPNVREWYPAGRLLTAIALYGGALPILLLPLSGGSYDDLRVPLADLMRRFSKEAATELHLPPMSEQQQEFAVAMMLKTLPGFMAGYWMIVFTVNTYLAARVAQISGVFARDWPDLPAMKLPKDALVVFAVGVLAVFATGVVSIGGIGMLGSFMVLFFFAGLGLMHSLAQRRTVMVLFMTYGALLLAAPYTAIALILGGLTDTAFDLKARFGGPRPVG